MYGLAPLFRSVQAMPALKVRRRRRGGLPADVGRAREAVVRPLEAAGGRAHGDVHRADVQHRNLPVARGSGRTSPAARRPRRLVSGRLQISDLDVSRIQGLDGLQAKLEELHLHNNIKTVEVRRDGAFLHAGRWSERRGEKEKEGPGLRAPRRRRMRTASAGGPGRRPDQDGRRAVGCAETPRPVAQPHRLHRPVAGGEKAAGLSAP